MKRLLLFVPILAIAASCSMAQLDQTATNVKVVTSIDDSKCENLGQVFGKGGGMFGGAWLKDESLMNYASNDLRNKAAEKGATHVVASTHQMGNTSSGKYGGSTSTATIMGIAYRCNMYASL